MSDFSNGINAFSGISESLITHKCKAKYYPTADGGRRLASVIQFSVPIFREDGYEKSQPLPPGYNYLLAQLADAERCGARTRYNCLLERLRELERRYFGGDLFDDFDNDCVDADESREIAQRDLVARAVRRAKGACFDMIMCNPDMDAFATLTFDPKKVDSTQYSDVYDLLKVWLSNRVQRNALKYILVPEHHKDGEKIHFHAVFTSKSLKLVPARYKGTGRLLKKFVGGVKKQLYNIADWEFGYTSVELISGENAVDKVAKYIFKYMGKQMGEKIGGRFYLHGGKMILPSYEYADDAESLFEGEVPKYLKDINVTSSVKFSEWNFI